MPLVFTYKMRCYVFFFVYAALPDLVFNFTFSYAALPDLVVNVEELERHVRVDAIPLSYLRCSYEENCLAASARTQWYNNQHYVRRLLRFTTRIENRGLASFVPDVPRSRWQWHQCHAHYHSMEVFSRYDLVSKYGVLSKRCRFQIRLMKCTLSKSYVNY